MEAQPDPYLQWISNENLESAVTKVYTAIQKAVITTNTLKGLQKNVIDPFPVLFETLANNITVEEWIDGEAQRQRQKTLMNKIGEFHQEVLGNIDGWTDLGRGHKYGIDLKKNDGTIFAEIKNKGNTLNGASGNRTHQKLVSVANKNPQATVYVVQIIRTRAKPYNEVWESVSFTTDPRVWMISGELFYTLVTGSPSALNDLYEAIPLVLKSIIEEHGQVSASDSTVMDEIKRASESHSEASYLKYFFDHASRNSKIE